MFRFFVDRLQVHLLASRTRKHSPELEPNEQAAEREYEAEDPKHERSAHRSDRAEDGGRCREDAGSNDTTDARRLRVCG